MSNRVEKLDFRDLDRKFLIVVDIDDTTKMMMDQTGFTVRSADNAMIVFGYYDCDAGLSFELICSASRTYFI